MRWAAPLPAIGAALVVAALAHAQQWSTGGTGISTAQIVGTITNDNAAPGNIGEFVSASVGGDGFSATLSNATPTIVTATGNPLASRCVVAPGSPIQCVLPVYFQGLTGTSGVTNLTPYFVDPASISGATFRIATSITNALAGIDIGTTGTDSGQAVFGTYTATSGSAQATTAINLTAGDWDCSGTVNFLGVASTAPTLLGIAISGGPNAMTGPAQQQLQLAFTTGALTNILASGTNRRSNASAGLFYMNYQVNWTGGATNPVVTGTERCRRMR